MRNMDEPIINCCVMMVCSFSAMKLFQVLCDKAVMVCINRERKNSNGSRAQTP